MLIKKDQQNLKRDKTMTQKLLKNTTIILIAAGALTAAIHSSSQAQNSRAYVKHGTKTHSVMFSNIKKTRRFTKALRFTIANDMKSKIETMQWTFEAGSKGRPLLSGNQYRMVNSVVARGLKHGKRTLAANLKWLSKNSNAFNVRIRRLDGNGELRYGDRIALEVKGYGWLRYKKQNYGINLSDDNNRPHYIFVVRGGKSRTKIVSGMPFALYSAVLKTEITYCSRTYGIDLGYKGRSKCGGRIANYSGKLFGKNGLLARDGLSGKAFTAVKNHLCEAGVTALSAAVIAKSGGTTAKLVLLAAPVAIHECRKI